MQKPILILYMAIVACIATVLYASQYASNKIITNLTEGIHPKTESLVITCPTDTTFYVDENCEALILLNTPVSSCLIIALSYAIDGGSTVNVLPGPGGFPSTIDLGIYSVDTLNVMWTITDSCIPPSNETCAQQVFIRDTISPTIICPGDISIGNNNDGRNTLISIDQPEGDDNCGIASIINDYNNTGDASDEYPLGTTIVIWIITDSSGNTASCAMNIIVFDNTPPVLSCPPTINVSCVEPAPYPDLITFLNAGGSAMDENQLDTLSFSWLDDLSDNQTCPETVLRRYSIADINGNLDTCNQLIIIHDMTPPTAVCRDITVNLDVNGEATLMASQLNNGSTDNCGATLSFSTGGGLFFGCNDIVMGGPPISIVLTVTDLCGNTSTCTSQVTVRDSIFPKIICPMSVTMNANQGFCYSTNVVLGTPVSSDNCSVISTVATFNGSIVSGLTQFPVGTNTVIWTITDTGNNTSTCGQTVTIIDNQNPTITCPANVIVNANNGACYATNVSLGSPTTNDNCGVFSVVATYSGSMFTSSTQIPVGNINTITWTVTDVNGRTSSCTQNVQVNDNQPPTITCPINVTVNANNGVCYATNVNLGTPMTNDNCGVATTIPRFNGLVVTSMTQFPVSNTNMVIWTVTDNNGLTATCTQTVRVNDTQPPNITCPTNVTFSANGGVCYATNVNLGTPVSTDNCSIQSNTPRLNGVVVTNSTQFPVGNSTVVWTTTDASGLTATCNQNVFILDNQPPTITCPINVTVNANNGVCYATNVSLGTPTTNDNCGVMSVVPRFGGNVVTSSTQFPVSTTNSVIWTVTDVNGNTATCTQIVNVVDNQNPTITCPPNVSVNADLGVCYATNVMHGTPTTNDNCMISTVIPRFGGMVVTSSTQFPVGATNSVIWTVTDVNGRTATCTQNVSVADSQAPMIICPSNQNVNLNNSCSLVVPDLRPLTTATDNCPQKTITQSPTAGTVLPSSHGQVHAVTFTVTDGAGNTATCGTTMTGIDNQGPDIACEGFRMVSLSMTPELPAYSFVTSASDNCGGPLTYLARRMGNICGGNTPDDFGNYVEFCCNDVNDTIRVVIRATDARGNYTECMTEVLVKDYLAPTISINIPDISISCEYPLNLNNLSVFGTYVAQGATRQNIVINDPGNPFYPTGIAGQDGVYQDNCPGAIVSVTYRNLLGMCNTGQIKRDFVITDIGGNSTNYTQMIHVIDVHKFNVNDITWPPANVDYFFCNETNPNTDSTGVPVLNTDNCNLVAATYSDQIFNHPLHCSYVKRTWSVIDWCQFQTNSSSNAGKWLFIQNIYIRNTVAPTITPQSCRDTTICIYTSNCTASATFSASGTDDCIPISITWSYKIDLNNNGGTPDLVGSGATVSGVYNEGIHKLTWDAKDKCGNISSCSFLFTIKDCKAPSAIAMQGLATNLVLPNKAATMKASSFNNFSSDNCTSLNQLKYSFSSNVNDTLRTFNCDSLGQRLIHMWVTDKAGNQSKASTYVIVQDNNNLCGQGNRVNIVGKVFTEDKVNLPETKIMIDGGETEAYFMTDAEGKYNFHDLAKYNNYELVPFRDTNHIEGITTLDLVMIQRHILGVKLFESPYKMIAADVNNSQSITGADLVELRKLVLGIQSDFTKNTSWRFVDASFTFSDPNYPWPFLEKLNYTALESNMSNSDFVAVKIGDVNNSSSQNYSRKVENRSKQRTNLIIDATDIRAGELVSIPIKSDNLEGLTGLQWTFELENDLEYEGFEAEQLGFRNENISEIFRNGKKYITVSYDDFKGIKTTGPMTLFNLNLRAKKDGKISRMIFISNDITKSVAYNQEDIESDISLSISTEQKEYSTIVMQNHPNPFNSETSIKVQMKDKGPLTINVYDGEGALVYRNSEVLNAGLHSIIIGERQLGNRFGVFYCKIKAKDLNEVIKILRIE